MTDISGRAAVVTGGGGAIGRALARELARRGAAVAVADMRIADAQKIADEIIAAGGKAVALYVDVCDRSSVKQMAADAKAALGPITLVFPNAGATSFDRLMDMSDEDVEWILTVNLMGVMHTVRAFLPDMIALGQGGHICATASMAGLLPGWIPVHAPYSAAKMGIIGLMMNLQLELSEHDINVTSYCPGGVASDMKKNNASYRPAKFGGPAEGEVLVEDVSFKANPIRFYTPEGVAPIVIDAIEKNMPMVFDHAEHRRPFETTYRNVVEACFDHIAEWEKTRGTPMENLAGASLD